MRFPYSLSPRSVITALALAGMALSQTSCGMIAHNVGRLMSIPASVLGEESGRPIQATPVSGEAPASSLLDIAPSPDLGPPAPVPTA